MAKKQNKLYETPKNFWFWEAAKPAMETAIKNLNPRTRLIESNETRPVPKHSAENMKNHLAFMWDDFLDKENKRQKEHPYINSKDYFKRTGVRSVRLPFTVYDYKTTTKIPSPSIEFVEALTEEPMVSLKDVPVTESFNYLNFYDSDTTPITKKYPGI